MQFKPDTKNNSFYAGCRELEEENANLQAEYERLRTKSTPESTPEELRGGGGDADMATEARLLRQHKGRLEARMQILEDHNRQLEAQLQRLRQLLDEVKLGNCRLRFCL